MHKSKSHGSYEGFTLIELLIAAAIIGILLSIAIPNLLKSRISANEANARKTMQTLRDAETMYFDQDLNQDGKRNYTNFIGFLGKADTLRDPVGNGKIQDSLIDSSFEVAVVSDGSPGSESLCLKPKAGYCITWSSDVDTTPASLLQNFGWENSMISYNITGRKDFAVFADSVIRCTLSTQIVGTRGQFEAAIGSSGCD